jgi:hypothetical protein
MNHRQIRKLVKDIPVRKAVAARFTISAALAPTTWPPSSFLVCGLDGQPDLYRLGINDAPVIVRDKSYPGWVYNSIFAHLE